MVTTTEREQLTHAQSRDKAFIKSYMLGKLAGNQHPWLDADNTHYDTPTRRRCMVKPLMPPLDELIALYEKDNTPCVGMKILRVAIQQWLDGRDVYIDSYVTDESEAAGFRTCFSPEQKQELLTIARGIAEDVRLGTFGRALGSALRKLVSVMFENGYSADQACFQVEMFVQGYGDRTRLMRNIRVWIENGGLD